MKFKNISVIGLGYIGLPTAALISSKGIKVFGTDIDEKAVEIINSGNIHIVEPGLKSYVEKAVDQDLLVASKNQMAADAYLITVPTPFKKTKEKNHLPEPDISYIRAASLEIAKVLKKGDLVILESTSPVGTTEKLSKWMSEERNDLTFPHNSGDDSDIKIAYCPERVMPGNIINELVKNDRVIGGITKKCSEAAKNLYELFVEGNCFITSSRTAEMVKLTENASRDVSIAFANELSVICDQLNINVWELISLANKHPRVDILQPGPGVGGHCIAVDPWFIVHDNPDNSKLIHTARLINDMKPSWVVDKIKKQIELITSKKQKNIAEISVAIFGISYKPDIDDLRESPALDIVNSIKNLPLKNCFIVEPNINELPRDLKDHVKLISSEHALAVADLIILLVDHKEFKEIELSNIQGKDIIDTKGVWSKKLQNE